MGTMLNSPSSSALPPPLCTKKITRKAGEPGLLVYGLGPGPATLKVKWFHRPLPMCVCLASLIRSTRLSPYTGGEPGPSSSSMQQHTIVSISCSQLNSRVHAYACGSSCYLTLMMANPGNSMGNSVMRVRRWGY